MKEKEMHSPDTNGNNKPIKDVTTDDGPTLFNDQSTNRELFLNNAFLFWSCRNRILADERMRYTNVEIISGVHMFGNLPLPTLGVYAEFWDRNPDTLLYEHDTRRLSLLYRLSGMVLSNLNNCSFVYPDGTTHKAYSSGYGGAWHDFVAIALKYNNIECMKTRALAKAVHSDVTLVKPEDYTCPEGMELQEVIDILTAKE